MKFSINYLGNFVELRDFIYSPEKEKAGNPYNCKFNLRVKSGEFAGLASCEYDIKEFRRFVSEVKELYKFRRTSVELKEICYGSWIMLSIDARGHVTVSGSISEGLSHSLEFMFYADQTAVARFIDDLTEFIK